eukprot:gb/GECG01008254.1/.p1 GENE.gb/GECG01008254.1/~~gb/GECG01008254.1/.p1  ORF type:complete len:158 (+),score=13.80 gb/GECG01008254.1/:1-474(+)
MKFYDFRFTLASGMLQAVSSQFGKVGADGNVPLTASVALALCGSLPLTPSWTLPYGFSCSEAMGYLLRASSLVLMILINTTGVALSVKGMQHVGSTLHTVLTVVINIFVSALLSWILFNEVLSSQWWIGAGIVSCGVALLVAGEAEAASGDEKLKES